MGEENGEIGEGKVKYTPDVLMIEVACLLLPPLASRVWRPHNDAGVGVMASERWTVC
jgi:hypothetical protein